MYFVGDIVECKDKEDMKETNEWLNSCGYETDFVYKGENKDRYGIEIVKVLGDNVAHWWNERPRYGTLKQALDYDVESIEKLLDHGDRETAIHIVKNIAYAFDEHNTTSKEFEDFTISYLGKEKYEEISNAWLTQKTNSFFDKVGMPNEMKPMSRFIIDESEE